MYKPIKKLSSSQIKVAESCSWLYYCKYLLRLPENGNMGSSTGSVAHDVLEILLNKDKYFDYVNEIVKKQELTAGLKRLLTKKLKKTEFYCRESVERAEKGVLVALSNDFWMDGYELNKPEHEFTIEHQYKIGGFIDVRGVKKLPNGKIAIKVRDYKLTSKIFSKKELEFNYQFFTYLLASQKDYPNMDLLESEVEFVFLQFPEDPIRKVKLKDLDQLKSYEEYLNYIQKIIDSFDESKAKSYMAADMGFPKKEEGFCKKLLCGMGKTEGQLKKDGNPYYACPMRYKFDYYILLDSSNKIVYSAFNKQDLDKYKDKNLKLEKKSYPGCPSWQRNNFTFYKDKEDKIDF